MVAYDMIVHLKQLYQEQTRHERFEISKALFQSQFVMNYNMNELNTTLLELLNILRTTEQEISKGTHVLTVQGTKKRGKAKKKGKKAKGASKCDSGALKPKAKVAKYDYCFHCGNNGHWKRNCKVYLEELRKEKGGETSTSDMLVYNMETKRLKSNDSNPTYLWYYRLGHISESLISRLHKNGLLDSFDFESIETCEPCLMRKMTKAPFNGKDMVRSLMSHVDLPDYFWGYALQTAVLILNHAPSKSVEKMPYEMRYRKHPSMSFLKIWGCKAYVKRLSSDKLGPKSDKCYFVGYPKKTRGYSFYNPTEGKAFVARTAVFLEKEFLLKGTSGRKLEVGEVLPKTDIGQSTGEVAKQVLQGVVAQYSEQMTQEPHRSGRICPYCDYEIWQMDVKTAFLNGRLIDDVYMTQPKGFVDPQNAGKVCKLQRSIYGPKQASRSWNLRFDDTIKEFGFIKNEDEPCVYKKVNGNAVIFLVLYVDDILLIENDIPSL
ncbi:hypothetical protein CRG98_031387 [Punica granatum]|uniref:CCHC-type domain-containing protein n=1 Tax=Punica granatum TaxID=22663 RepID=A0A2I0IW34_PUNGR|nr:hypothetical protein CRG98_031387 [Punica granatum]